VLFTTGEKMDALNDIVSVGITVFTFAAVRYIFYIIIICINYKPVFPELFKLEACIFIEITLFESTSRSTPCNSGSME
jgi:hypothetical protein